jgi:hypothetical protein
MTIRALARAFVVNEHALSSIDHSRCFAGVAPA